MTHSLLQVVLRDCSTCRSQRAFEALVCPDGHGADCPELACVECGEAVVVGSFDFEMDFEIDILIADLPHVSAAA